LKISGKTLKLYWSLFVSKHSCSAKNKDLLDFTVIQKPYKGYNMAFSREISRCSNASKEAAAFQIIAQNFNIS
jgi:hypothetical protein